VFVEKYYMGPEPLVSVIDEMRAKHPQLQFPSQAIAGQFMTRNLFKLLDSVARSNNAGSLRVSINRNVLRCFRKLRIFAPDPYDLALSKLERNSPKDQGDVEYLARTVPLSTQLLQERYERELRPNLMARQTGMTVL